MSVGVAAWVFSPCAKGQGALAWGCLPGLKAGCFSGEDQPSAFTSSTAAISFSSRRSFHCS